MEIVKIYLKIVRTLRNKELVIKYVIVSKVNYFSSYGKHNVTIKIEIVKK